MRVLARIELLSLEMLTFHNLSASSGVWMALNETILSLLPQDNDQRSFINYIFQYLGYYSIRLFTEYNWMCFRLEISPIL